MNKIPSKSLEQFTSNSLNIVIFFQKSLPPSTVSLYHSYRRLVPAKLVYVLVRTRYFLAVKYKHKLRGESSSAERKQQAMSDTSCAVGCQNRIEILSKLS